jgi:Cu/Ag efflux pump CusA
MRWLIGSSLRLRRVVVVVAAGLVVLGIGQLWHAAVDPLPEFGPPAVQVQTEALGLSAPEVEQLITVPLEQDLLAGVPWLDTMRSASIPGLSSIELIFDPGTDLLRARQVVQERLTQAAGLPNVSATPHMLQPLSSTSRIMMIRLSSATVSPIEMSVLARWTIRPKLLGVQGVANVSIWGQRERQLQVQVDPDRLATYGLSLDRIIETSSGHRRSRSSRHPPRVPEASSTQPTNASASSTFSPSPPPAISPRCRSSERAAARCVSAMSPTWSRTISLSSATPSSPTVTLACCCWSRSSPERAHST